MTNFSLAVTQAVLSGLLVGGVYGLFSIGFSLAFGVMRIVNFAHGELVMLGMYIGFFVASAWGGGLMVAIPLAFAAIALLGALLYAGVYRPFVGKATLQQLLVAIAVALILQVSAQLAFGPDMRSQRSEWAAQYLMLGDIFLSWTEIVAFLVAVGCAFILELILKGTRFGQTLRAVADDGEVAGLVGVNAGRINLAAFALSCGLAGIAGAVLATFYPVNPSSGFSLMPIALIATVIGGMGSIRGAFFGGLVCGVVEQLTGALWSTALQDVPLYVLLLLFLALRPYGMFGQRMAA